MTVARPAPAADPALHEAVRGVLRARSRALAARDAAALRDALHPLFTYTNASGSVLDREGYLDLTVRGPLHWRDQRVEVGSVTRASDVVVVTGVVEDRVALEGEEHVWTFATTQVYVEDSGRLLYLVGHTGPAGDGSVAQ